MSQMNGPRSGLAAILLGMTMLVGACGSSSSSSSNSGPVVDYPYDTCYAGDVCQYGLTCAATTLPASTGYTGYFCTSGCTYDTDCVSVPANYAAACIVGSSGTGQCYLTCPSGGSTCPYDQSCLIFDSSTGPISLCTP